MTITTADLPVQRPATRPGRAALTFTLTPLALAALLLSNDCRAQWRVTPSVQARETYSDNVNNQPDESARGSFVSEIAPAISVTGRTPRLRVTANAEVRKYAYSNNDTGNVRDSDRRYAANAQAVAVKEWLYVDANASGSRQAVSAFGPVPNGSYAANNGTNIRTWSLSPYLRHSFGTTAGLTARFTRDAVEGGSGVGFGNSMNSTRAVDLQSGPRFTDLGWNVHYSHQDLSSQNTGDTIAENSLVGLNYRVHQHLTLTTSAGYDKYEYNVLGADVPAGTTLSQDNRGRSWTAGFIWAPSARTRLQASAGRRYFGKTGALDASYRTRQTTWTLTYADNVTTTRSQFMLPAAIDTAAMLDSLFKTQFPDPLVRQQAVQAYLALSGLPPSIANPINFLSNRYMRNKRLQGSVLFKGARSSALVSVFKERMMALSLQQEDSALLPSQLSSLNDDTDQRGVNGTFDYRLSSRTSAHASLYAVNALSLRTGIDNRIRQLSTGLTTHFSQKMTGTLELRHSKGRAGIFDNRDYHENAVVAALSVQY